MSGALGHLAGLGAESAVERHYAEAGARLLARRWRGAAGEIDLVVQLGDTLIFVEVKKSRSFARAAERLGERQILRLMGAAQEYLGLAGLGLDTVMRFDVALVDASGQIRVLENALSA
ncbi:YraN family protein [Plastorhodobacter daqingensis]|uniref:UPF0102 protein ACFQXB_06560 n=1 Tax=Plastorhodobacter daqingensis TaxID=1387281 RepID=A0ABW2UGQ7_9RHOB